MALETKIKEVAAQLAAEVGLAEPKAPTAASLSVAPSVELIDEPRAPKAAHPYVKKPY